ncbi:MAG TPA: primosomal protein N' [Streptosporangiaceae bacterium]
MPAAGPGRKVARPKTRKPKKRPEAAETRPVARVAVDLPLPHLDRPFDYLVPADSDDTAVPGVRVRVRFAGQLVDGFLLDRVAESGHTGRLAFLERVVSPEPVLTPEVAVLARDVADRYAGTLADVLRLAVPPRHARVEAEAAPEPASAPEPPEPGPLGAYPTGPEYLAALAKGGAPRAVWTALPGPDHWPAAVATAVRAALAAGRGAVVVAPDGRDVARIDAALTAELGAGRHVALTAELGPAERYRRWLAVRRGGVKAVVGTRAAQFAPVHDLGLVVLWDDGDDTHAEKHAPYPHSREVLALRAHRSGAAALFGSFTRTAETTQLIAAGWAGPLHADRATVRSYAPRVSPAGDDAELARDQAARSARLPSVALRAARAGLATGPVLIQVPRRGYLPALACARCRAPARCPSCQGPLSLKSAHAVPYCRWCGRLAGDRRCPSCAATAVRAIVVGARRTAEELGRAFPSVPVRTSGRDGVLAHIDAAPALVVSTPGAEPVAEGGYAAALLLDGWVLVGRPDLRAAEETLRRWMNAAALVRPGPDGGQVVVLADAGLPVVQALIRWDPVTHAERELAERAELAFPPVARMAAVTGAPDAVRDLLAHAELPPGADVLGPVPAEPARRGGDDDSTGALERALVRVRRPDGAALARALRAAQGVRSARKAADPVRVRVDPVEGI